MTGIVTVLFGGPSPEHDISILTGLQCERILRGAGWDVLSMYWSRDGRWLVVPHDTEARDYIDEAPRSATPAELRLEPPPRGGFFRRTGLRSQRIDQGTVLNCLHGGLGEGGGISAIFELMAIPSTGGSFAASAIALDKLAFAALMAATGISCLPRERVSAASPSFEGPYIVKPRFGGSSIGIEVAEDFATAASLAKSSPHLRAGAVIEPYRPELFDLNVSFRTSPDLVVSRAERPIRPNTEAIYSYESKYTAGQGLIDAAREFPAKISRALDNELATLATRVARATGLTGVVRVDFLSDGHAAWVNEVNNIPGAMSLYLWPQDEAAVVLEGAISEAQSAPEIGGFVGYNQGAALRSASGIASKLVGLSKPSSNA